VGVTNYYSVDGEIYGERAGTGARTDYQRDALGSVTGTTDSAGAVVNTYRHKPYGSQLAKTGTGPDPKFLWVGTIGARETGLAHSSHYIRARHYAQEEGNWTTVDPLWPREPAYGYVNSSPANFIDPQGLQGSELQDPGIVNRPGPPPPWFPTGRPSGPTIIIDRPGSGIRDPGIRPMPSYPGGPVGPSGYPVIYLPPAHPLVGWL